MRIEATIERRILANYRVEPAALAALLPPPFRPATVHGYGVAGICLIRLAGIRPAGLPPALGITTENAAHRIAVEWDTADGPVTGVYIPRRHSSSQVTATPAAGVYDCVELATDRWAMTPLRLDELRSSLFAGASFVPDSAFLMAGVGTTWCPQPDLVATS